MLGNTLSAAIYPPNDPTSCTLRAMQTVRSGFQCVVYPVGALSFEGLNQYDIL